MAANRIQLKRTSVSGRTPNTTNAGNSQYIATGELALNLADGVLYTSDGTDLINLTPSGGSITVRSTNGSGGAVNTAVTGVTGINFDESTGLHVTDQGSGNVFVSLGSGYKYITVTGQDTITAVGEDTLAVAAGQGIILATSNTAPKTLTITSSGYINVAGQYTFTNTHSFQNTITFNSTINGTANNALYLGGTIASGYQTTAGLSGNVATLTANAAGYLNGKTESNLNVNNSLTSNNASYLGGTIASGYQTTAGLSTSVAVLTANAAGYLNGKTESNLNVNSSSSALTANNASYLGGNTASDLTSYSSNATNISSGTVSEARLPFRMDQNLTTTNNVTFANVALTGGTISTLAVNNNDIVNKQYADSIATGVNFHPAVRLVTNTELTPVTYYNGPSSNGVGATLTKTSSYSALSVDSVSAAYLDRILVRNQSNTVLNGVYSVSNTGSGSYAWVLTRAFDYDQVGAGTNEIDKGDLIYVLEGTTGAGTAWVENSDVTAIGTDAITFVQFSSKALYSLTDGDGLYYSVGSAYDGAAAATLAVNNAYIATISANNASYLGGTAAAKYVQNSGAFTISGIHTHSANIIMSNGAVIIANGSLGTSGQVLATNGSSMYWATATGGSGGGSSVTVSDTAPGSPASGDLWYYTGTSELFIYYNDGNSSQWVTTATTYVPSAFSTLSVSGVASFSSNVTISNTRITANGSTGTSGQVLTSSGTGANVYWSTPSPGTTTGKAIAMAIVFGG